MVTQNFIIDPTGDKYFTYLFFKKYSKENLHHTKINGRLHKYLLGIQVSTEIKDWIEIRMRIT